MCTEVTSTTNNTSSEIPMEWDDDIQNTNETQNDWIINEEVYKELFHDIPQVSITIIYIKFYQKLDMVRS